MRKLYSLLSIILIANLSFAQKINHSSVSHKDELTNKEIWVTLKKYTGYSSLEDVLSEISKKVGVSKSLEREYVESITPYVKSDIRFMAVSIKEGKLKPENLAAFYSKELNKYKTLYSILEKDGNKNAKNQDAFRFPFGPGQPCQNGDFETQTTAGWEGSWGQGASPWDPTMTAGFDNPGINSGTGQHVIMTSGNDPNITAIPCVFPGGGGASFRLGDNGGGGNKSALLKQTYQVSGAAPYLLYHYAVVFEDAGHPVNEQPFFKVRVFSNTTNDTIDCATINVDATNSTGLLTSGSIKYKNWTSVLVPLNAFAGQDITAYFIAGDCNNSPTNGGTHDGYAYIDAECNYLPSIQQSATSICGGQNMTLTAPAGLGSYTWSGPGIVSGGNSQVVTVNQPGTYTVNMVTQTSAPNTPCTFALTTTVTGNNTPIAQFSATSVCVGSPTQFFDSTTFVTGPITWAWDFENNGSVDATSQNPTFTYSAAGTYTVSLTATGPGGCFTTTTQTVTVTPIAVPAVTSVPTTCSNVAAFNLSANVGGGTWSGNGITNASTGAFDPSQASSGINVITYTVTGACAGTDTIQINIVPSASPNWTAPAAMCADAVSVNLNTLITGATGGTWSGSGVTGNTFSPNGLSGPINVTYTVGSAPCVGTESHIITVTPNANATITQAGPLCSNASAITLSGATAGGTWSGTGVTNPSTGAFSPSSATIGNNVITYTIAGACGDVDTMTVVVLQSGNPAYTLPASICAGTPAINLNTLVTGTPGGTWSGSGVSGNTFDPSGLSGNVSITYTVGQGICQQTSTQVINVDGINAAFTATPSSGMAPLNVDFINGSSNAVSYSWNLGNGQTSTATDPSTIYTSTGSYTVTLIATNASGCSDTATIIIDVTEVSVLVIPNVFTPNGDGNNDYFKPVLAEGLSKFNMVIYDRWGLKMSEVTNESLGWDGNAKNGSNAPDGTYYYIVTADGADAKKYEFTGYVSLIRAK